jgi:D-lactate dehydrogenase (cytochrome)
MFQAVTGEFGATDFNWATRTEDRNRLWRARHSAYYAGKALKPGCDGLVTDVCVPISALAECIARTRSLIAESGLLAPLVGHVGDGNFHLLILVEPGNASEMNKATSLASAVNRTALEFGGTVTGEHGVGSGKKKYMADEHGDAYQLMGLIKKSMDPRNIMNPGKLVSIDP